VLQKQAPHNSRSGRHGAVRAQLQSKQAGAKGHTHTQKVAHAHAHTHTCTPTHARAHNSTRPHTCTHSTHTSWAPCRMHPPGGGLGGR
jgi:hypothetical protein